MAPVATRLLLLKLGTLSQSAAVTEGVVAEAAASRSR